MGVRYSPETFQQKINDFFKSLYLYVHKYTMFWF